MELAEARVRERGTHPILTRQPTRITPEPPTGTENCSVFPAESSFERNGSSKKNIEFTGPTGIAGAVTL